MKITTKTIGSSGIILVVFITALVIGGTIESLPTDDDTYEVIKIDDEMSTCRAAHQATALKSGKVLITGGMWVADATAEIYNPETQTFHPVASMAVARRSHVATLLPDGRVLVTGGLDRENRVYASAEIYDPLTKQWTAAGRMSEARYGHFAVPLPDGRVLLVGGKSDEFIRLASAEVFDPATSTFLETGSMKLPRVAHVAVALADGRVLVTGGSTRSDRPLRSAEIYDPKTGEFHSTGNMVLPRLKHAAALLPDGKVLILGGIDGSNTEDFGGRYKSTEIYDPETGKFSPGPDMHWPRFKIRDAVAVLPSGVVVVGGGFSRLEVYDPIEKVFKPVKGELESEHRLKLQAFNTATPLPTNEVLVIGGSSSGWLVQPTQ